MENFTNFNMMHVDISAWWFLREAETNGVLSRRLAKFITKKYIGFPNP